MKKSVITTILAVLCSVVFVFGLTACNNNEGENENGGNTGGNETHEHIYSAEWSSDNTAVATVESGKVTAVAEGTATITAKAGDKTANCSVIVKTVLKEDTDFDALVSDKVTETEWDNAFSDAVFENATIKLNASSNDLEASGTLFVDGTTMYMSFMFGEGEGKGQMVKII